MATESEQNILVDDSLFHVSEGFDNLPGFSAYFLFACGHSTFLKEAADFLNSLHPGPLPKIVFL